MLISELTNRFGGRGNDFARFTFNAPDIDLQAQEVIAYLESRGVRRMPATWDYGLEKSPNGFYTVVRFHGYESSDYTNAEYLWFQKMDGSEWDIDTDGNRHPDGMLPLLVESIPKRAKMMSSGRNVLLVSASFRTELEQERFVGMAFGATKQLKEKKSKGEYLHVPCDPAPDRVVWEIRPTIELPRMHPDVFRAPTAPGVPFGDQGPGAFKNKDFDDVQLVYTRSALRRSGAFDIAHTWEYASHPDERCFIVSQRFYQYCKAKRISATFVPVKIIEGE